MMTPPVFSTKSMFTRFASHLEIHGNNRILFSGPFGIGKTTFLQSFFTTVPDNKYFVLRIDPLRYTIASNEDIYELIKYDILFQLLDSGALEGEKFEFSPGLKLVQFISDNYEHFGRSLISIWNSTGKKVLDTLKLLEKYRNKYSEFSSEIDKDLELSRLKQYIEKGDVNWLAIERDLVFEAITNLMLSISEKYSTVLIIDDLDRIDPAHVFRILNVFSTISPEQSVTSNTLGFTKTIIVCDVLNLKSIFRKMYGVSTDFNGYIDKYYSRAIFHYDNSKEIKLWVQVVIKRNLSDTQFNEAEKAFVIDLLCAMLSFNLISVRTIEKLIGTDIVNRFDAREDRYQYSYMRIQHVLLFLFGSMELLADRLNVLKDYINAEGTDIMRFGWENKFRYYLENVLVPLDMMFVGLYPGAEHRNFKFNVSQRSNKRMIEYSLLSESGRYKASIVSDIQNLGTKEFVEIICVINSYAASYPY